MSTRGIGLAKRGCALPETGTAAPRALKCFASKG